MDEQRLIELEKKIKWNKKHLRIVFIIASVALLMITGHSILHATGRL